MTIYKEIDRLSPVFAALADPTRRAIVRRLASGDADVSELMKPFDLRQPTISKHLIVLERAGLVMRTLCTEASTYTRGTTAQGRCRVD